MNVYIEGMQALAPELALTALALVVLVADLVTKGRDSKRMGYLTLAGLTVVGGMLAMRVGEPSKTVFGMVIVDSFGTFFKLFTVAAVAAVTVFVLSDKRERKHGIGEYYFLLLGASVGIFFMVSTQHLLLLVLGLELLSLASYSLAGFHKGERKSAEAAMKYVVFGGLSAGIMIYGMSLLFGITGTLDLGIMATQALDALPAGGLSNQLNIDVIPVSVAMVMILAGLAYKMSVVPFHFWTPDVYQGAPTPVTTFLAVASKAAGVAALLRFIGALFMTEGVHELVVWYGDKVGLLVGVIAAVTMTLGNLSALRQQSLKRMLAYSSIAHAGYILIGVATMTPEGFDAAMFYMAAYYVMTLGAFGVLLYFESALGSDHLEDMRGYGWKAPMISIAMVAFLVSLTGLPPTVGFFGKYLLMKVGIAEGFGWLVVVAFLNSVVSLFYYFSVAKTLFLKDPSDKPALSQPLFAGLITALGLMTVYFGLLPDSIQKLVDLCSLMAS